MILIFNFLHFHRLQNDKTDDWPIIISRSWEGKSEGQNAISICATCTRVRARLSLWVKNKPHIHVYLGDIVDNGLLKGAGPKLQTWPRNETVQIEVRNAYYELLNDFLTSFRLS